jgi:hypothetical protein
MKDTTRDFVAVEILILVAIALSSVVLPGLLSQLAFGLSIVHFGVFLYLCRWVGWAMQYCRARPHLHRIARRLIGWSAVLLCVIGVGIILDGWNRFGLRVGIPGVALVVVGVGLIAWMSKALTSGERGPKADAPASSLPLHQDV